MYISAITSYGFHNLISIFMIWFLAPVYLAMVLSNVILKKKPDKEKLYFIPLSAALFVLIESYRIYQALTY